VESDCSIGEIQRMKDLNEIQCFVKAVELKSFSAAAKAMGLPKSSMSRKVRYLEERLGLSLMIRNTRSLSLTDAGRQLFERSALAMRELSDAEDALNPSRQGVKGKLQITGPADFVAGPFNHLIASFINDHPDIHIELLLTERLVDLIGESFDFAFRIGNLKESGFIAKKLRPLEALIVGSPSYLEKRGTPRTVTELERHDCLGFCPEGTVLNWSLKGPTGRQQFAPTSRLTVNALLSLKGAVLHDLGLALIPQFLVETEIEKKQLKVVLPEWSFTGHAVHLVYPKRKFLPPAMRAFIESACKHPLF
jgi:DNA-binding transcriptional LysR family regulator